MQDLPFATKNEFIYPNLFSNIYVNVTESLDELCVR